MTFSITVPNATQSPGLFPAQNNTNFQRLQDIINNDHNFTNTSSVAQGIHKQCTFINQASAPMSLPAGNGILYSFPDSTGASQLFWYNNASTVQITPGLQALSGTVTLNAASGPSNPTKATIFADPGFFYQAYFWFGLPSNLSVNNSGIAVHYADANNLISPTQSGSFRIAYDVSPNQNDLILQNFTIVGGPYVIRWTLEVIGLK